MFETFQARSEIKKALETQTGTIADIIEDKLKTLDQEVKDGMPCIEAQISLYFECDIFYVKVLNLDIIDPLIPFK